MTFFLHLLAFLDGFIESMVIKCLCLHYLNYINSDHYWWQWIYFYNLQKWDLEGKNRKCYHWPFETSFNWSRKAGREPIENLILSFYLYWRTGTSVGGDFGFSSSFTSGWAELSGELKSNSFYISNRIFLLSWTGITFGIDAVGLWSSMLSLSLFWLSYFANYLTGYTDWKTDISLSAFKRS